MKIKIMKAIIPVVSGIIIILGILMVIAFIHYGYLPFSEKDIWFFGVFVPIVAIIAIIIQLTLALPIWERYKIKNKFFGLTIIPFTGIVSLIGGLAFGFVFSDNPAGIKDLLEETLTGVIAFFVYWTVNAFTIKLIEIKFNK
jgi:hypothetical protein